MRLWFPSRRAAPDRRRRHYAQSTSPGPFAPLRHAAVRRTLGTVAAAGLLAGLGYGARRAFLVCPLFTLRHVCVETGETIPADHVLSYLRLEEGRPLFDADIEGRRQALLRDAPPVKDIVINRLLPDRLTVRIVQREAVARVGRTTRVVDSDGWVFIRYTNLEALPMLIGVDLARAEPGTRLGGLTPAALQLIERCRNERHSLPLVEVNVAQEDCLLCLTADQRQLRLAWEEMGVRTARSRTALDRRIAYLLESMNTEAGRTRRLWDLTVAGRIYAR